MRSLFLPILSIFVAISAISCQRKADTAGRVVPVETPSEPSSRLPFLTTNNWGQLFFSWVEDRDSSGVVMKYSKFSDGTWSGAERIAEGDDWFVNWADFPSIAVAGDRPLIAHWLHKIPGNTYSYEVNMSLAGTGSEEWSPALTPHHDGTATEHGFVSMVPWNGDSILAVWLDGRATARRTDAEYGDLSKAMTIRSAVISADGTVTEKYLIDSSVCDCCQTSLARTGSGAIAAYRDRTGDEIRDIYVSRYEAGSWSVPIPVHEDGWQIGGCPVNGPGVAARGDTILVAWFTGAGDSYKVKAAFSYDGGESFDAPIRIDGGSPIGRVDAAFLDSDLAVVSWMEKSGDRAELKLRSLTLPDGVPGPPLTVTGMDPARRSGFPQAEPAEGKLFLAWTETGEQPGIRMAAVAVSELRNR